MSKAFIMRLGSPVVFSAIFKTFFARIGNVFFLRMFSMCPAVALTKFVYVFISLFLERAVDLPILSPASPTITLWRTERFNQISYNIEKPRLILIGLTVSSFLTLLIVFTARFMLVPFVDSCDVIDDAAVSSVHSQCNLIFQPTTAV